MRLIDSHFHGGRPRSFFEQLCKRKGYPRAAPNKKGGYTYWREEGREPRFNLSAQWFELDQFFEHMHGLGHEVDVVCSAGPFSLHFSDLPAAEGRDAAMQWNEDMAALQREHPGHVWASAAVPLVDAEIAVEVLDHAITKLGLTGANLPGSVGNDQRIDADRLEPFYARCAALGVPLFLHPSDAVFSDIFEGYKGALNESLGRVIEVSVAASRLILSGLMERHPSLKIVISHTGGALPYQSGRMDKNTKKAELPRPASTYIRRMFTDTVSPHAAGIRFAVDYYGIDQVMYGTDYPCWEPATALKLIDDIGLSTEEREKIFSANARRILGLRDTPLSGGQPAHREPALA
jgi:aminocarboxymuconate-semialdehyde decarboxylase